MAAITSTPEGADPRWRSLYFLGGIAAVVSILLTLTALVVFVVWPPPLEGGAAEWFALFQDSPFLGLLSLDLILMIVYVLLIPIVLAMYVAQRRAGEGVMLLGITLFLVAIPLYFASNTAVEMLSLSRGYAAATTEAQRASFLAAGQAMLATYQGTAFHANYILGSIAGVLIVMPVALGWSTAFSKATAYLGIWANLLGMGLYLPRIGITVSAISGLFFLAWYVLLARRFFQLGRGSSTHTSPRAGLAPRIGQPATAT